MSDLKPKVFPDGERADEKVFLLDVSGQAGHAAANAAAVDSNFAVDEQIAAVTIRQHVQQRSLARTAAHQLAIILIIIVTVITTIINITSGCLTL